MAAHAPSQQYHPPYSLAILFFGLEIQCTYNFVFIVKKACNARKFLNNCGNPFRVMENLPYFPDSAARIDPRDKILFFHDIITSIPAINQPLWKQTPQYLDPLLVLSRYTSEPSLQALLCRSILQHHSRIFFHLSTQESQVTPVFKDPVEYCKDRQWLSDWLCA